MCIMAPGEPVDAVRLFALESGFVRTWVWSPVFVSVYSCEHILGSLWGSAPPCTFWESTATTVIKPLEVKLDMCNCLFWSRMSSVGVLVVVLFGCAGCMLFMELMALSFTFTWPECVRHITEIYSCATVVHVLCHRMGRKGFGYLSQHPWGTLG